MNSRVRGIGNEEKGQKGEERERERDRERERESKN